MRTYVSLDFKSGINEAALAQFAHNALTRISGNARFSTLQALVDSDLRPACDAYHVALQEAADRSRSKIAAKKVARQVLVEVLEAVAYRLSTGSDSSEGLILEAGFQPQQPKLRTGLPPEQVQGLNAAFGSQPGEVVLTFDKTPQARLYALEWSSDGEHWINGNYSTARRAVLSGLPSRQVTWFRVYAIGTGQRKGQHSVPTQLFVL